MLDRTFVLKPWGVGRVGGCGREPCGDRGLATELYEDLDFTRVRSWLAVDGGRKAGGYLPVYAPGEVLHACGFLPVGIGGGGDRLEIIRGDAF
jgi:hypothetical protein